MFVYDHIFSCLICMIIMKPYFFIFDLLFNVFDFVAVFFIVFYFGIVILLGSMSANTLQFLFEDP